MSVFLSNFLPIVWVVVFFGGSILVHELGHYVAAKRMGLVVPKFSIGFGPKLFGFRAKGTEFAVSLLPIGGYAAIPQLADLSSIEGSFDLPKNLQTAPCHAKVIVSFAGPLANLLLAVCVATIVFFTGLPVPEETLHTTIGYVPRSLELHDGTEIPSPAHMAGLLPGDRILSVDGNVVKNFDDIAQFIVLGTEKDKDGIKASTIEIDRGGNRMKVAVNPAVVSANGNKGDGFRTIGIYPKQTLVVDGFHRSAAAKDSGLLRGDLVISANGTPAYNVLALHEVTEKSSNVSLEVERASGRKVFDIPVTVLAIRKPFVSVVLFKKRKILDIIPSDCLIDGSEQKFSNFQIFCNDQRLLRKNGASDGNSVISVNGIAATSPEGIYEATAEAPEISLQLATKAGTTTMLLDDISSVNFQGTEFAPFLGIKFAHRVAVAHPSPWRQIHGTIVVTIKTLRSLFSRSSDVHPRHLMGPAGLIKTFHSLAKNSFPRLLWFVLLVNVNLAILNLLPFPVLDGGVIAISLAGKFFGCKRLEKIFSKTQAVFFSLLMCLIAYVTFFDFRRIFSENHSEFELRRQLRLLVNHDD
ncbi:MAG: site-2 protease family protein [Puniceicoccales bacterium]|jgi:RIP metalloprotease RseP|nr:site-2 protease family protein [Puniceicoccales bacterium]